MRCSLFDVRVAVLVRGLLSGMTYMHSIAHGHCAKVLPDRQKEGSANLFRGSILRPFITLQNVLEMRVTLLQGRPESSFCASRTEKEILP